MEVDFAFLSDSAELVEGKIYVLGGGIDTLWAPQVPSVYTLTCVLKLTFDVAEIGRKHKLEIHIIDEDGKSIANVGADLEIPGKSPDLPKGWRQSFATVLKFQNLKLPKFGTYSFNIVVNNTSLKSIPLRLTQLVQTSGPAA